MNDLFDENGIWKVDDYFLLDAQRLNKAISYLKNNHPNCCKIGISVNDYSKEYFVDFQIIKNNFPEIKSFWMHCLLSEETDISPLYDLEHLEFVQWWAKKPLIIANFLKLECLHCIYPEKIHFESKKLKKLYITGAKSLLFLNKLPNLISLEIRDYKNENLSGIEKLIHLEDLTIRLAKKLLTLDEIKQCKSLKILTLENVNHNIDLSILSYLNIEELYLHFSIKNCDFIKTMKYLTTFLCREIVNNDLSPMFASKTLLNAYLYKHKKSYNYTKEEFNRRFLW